MFSFVKKKFTTFKGSTVTEGLAVKNSKEKNIWRK